MFSVCACELTAPNRLAVTVSPDCIPATMALLMAALDTATPTVGLVAAVLNVMAILITTLGYVATKGYGA